MKKCIAAALMTAAMLFTAASGASAISVQLDGNEIDCGTEPVNVEGRILVPVRAIFEALGAKVDWNDGDKTVFASRNGEYIKLMINSKEIQTGVFNSEGEEVEGASIGIDVPAMIIDDRTLVPVRAVSETLRADVQWDGDTETVIINNPKADDNRIYYASEYDKGRLYEITPDGIQRKKLSDKKVKNIKYYDGYVYYLSRDDNMLYRNDGSSEQQVCQMPVYFVGFNDNYVYYMERTDSNPENVGVLYRTALDTLESERLTELPARYAEIHGNYIFYNALNDHRLYAKNMTTLEVNSIDTGENITLYPFNCYFSDDYVFFEDSAGYNTISRFSPDGKDRRNLNDCYSTICSNQQRNTGKIIYINSSEVQDIYVMNIDGSDNHKIADLDSNWFSVNVLTQWENTIYYKNAFRDEVYSADLSGNSYGNYITNAADVKVKNGKLFAVRDGLYMGNTDGQNLTQIFNNNVSDYRNYGGYVYVTESSKGNLYKVGYDASNKKIINEYISEWDCNFAE